MKLYFGFLTCLGALGVRGEMEKCPPEVAEIVDQVHEQHPAAIACDAKLNALRTSNMNEEEIVKSACLHEECRRAAQLIYDIFPPDCQMEDWTECDPDIEGGCFFMTKKHYADLAHKECQWDLEHNN